MGGKEEGGVDWVCAVVAPKLLKSAKPPATYNTQRLGFQTNFVFQTLF
jgi:hypothetical protein